jgi:acetylornithine aminotransferase/acetylornithine/N-succinyldiaminopimelate aminotransferase
VAKGLGGGVPIGAVLAAPRADVLTPGDHGSTFGGGPLACAAGIATMRTIADENLIDNAVRMGDYLSESLLSLAPAAPIRGIRGRGLMLGVALSEEIAPRVATAALEHGVIVNAVGQRTLRLVPPLVLTRDDVDTAMRGLEAAFADVARSD